MRVDVIADEVARLARSAAGAEVVRWRSPAASAYRAALDEQVRGLRGLAARLRA